MAGNTVVLKPPTQGAVAGVLMVQCFAAAGLPAGVLNCVTGENGAGLRAVRWRAERGIATTAHRCMAGGRASPGSHP